MKQLTSRCVLFSLDACTEMILYSLCLVDYLHLCDKFTGNCTCFNVNHFKGLHRSPCEIFLSDANVEDHVDSIFCQLCRITLNFVLSLSLH